MLKSDARRKKLKAPSDRLEKAWANLGAQYTYLRFRENPALHGESVPRYVLDWLDHPTPGDYWSSQDISKSFQRINIPALHISGWYDMFLDGTIAGFQSLTKNAATAQARENQFLIAGPWQHLPWSDRIGPADFGREAQLDTDAILLRWFNHWLQDTGEFSAEPRVRHFVLSENKWREARRFPQDAKYRLLLHSQGRANSRKGDGTLSEIPAAENEPADIFIYDPEVPVIAPGGPSSAPGPHDQSQIESGNNVLVYTTDPLENPLRIFGIAGRHPLRRHHRRPRRLHRQASPCPPQQHRRLHLHRHRPQHVPLPRKTIRRERNHAMAIRSRSHLLPLQLRRSHPPRNRQQRLPTLRPQPRHRRPLAAGHQLGLATLHPNRLPRCPSPVCPLSSSRK